MVFILNQTSSLVNQYLSELRSKEIQKDRMRFRKNLFRLGNIISYELSKTLTYTPNTINTPLSETKINLPDQQPVLITVLRAGIPFFEGFLDFFDKADAAFIGSYRLPSTEGIAPTIQRDYFSCPEVNGRDVIICDPMLASGKSLYNAWETIREIGKPRSLHFASVIASPEGIAYLEQNIPKCQIWTAAKDESLNDHFYIVPGLGDAGDLSFGCKI